ncbi:YigZ family protein [Pontiella sp. NLcol2]|uniref:YigZ family protein n=1 Tax=Pontiella agarivorans TaxID=3038953 RepID=A0ABU5N1I4_9BACT|nr:YigZ family protein [Pontiella agarivorans]
MSSRYPVPAGRHRAETVEKKSRFIATLRRVCSPDEAKQFVNEIRSEYPDARHHCWAYVAGAPGSSHPCGMSDDGEPHGTAGRPMLQVLLNCGIGEIMVIVTRYFGGTKLGTGGLARAYSGAVQAVLESLPTEEAVDTEPVMIRTAFEFEPSIRHQLSLLKLDIKDTVYTAEVTLHIDVPADQMEITENHLNAKLPHNAFRWLTD